MAALSELATKDFSESKFVVVSFRLDQIGAVLLEFSALIRSAGKINIILRIIGLGVLVAVVNERKMVFRSEQCGGEAHEDVEAREKKVFSAGSGRGSRLKPKHRSARLANPGNGIKSRFAKLSPG
jgi:hypothetical protein